MYCDVYNPIVLAFLFIFMPFQDIGKNMNTKLFFKIFIFSYGLKNIMTWKKNHNTFFGGGGGGGGLRRIYMRSVKLQRLKSQTQRDILYKN